MGKIYKLKNNNTGDTIFPVSIFDGILSNDGSNTLNETLSEINALINNLILDVSSASTKQSDYLSSLSFASLGDSIISDQVTGLGTAISTKLGVNLIGNFAVGNAVVTNYSNTEINLSSLSNSVSSSNVLMNQVFRLMQASTPSGSQITWNHPITGNNYNIPVSNGTGLGLNIPNIIFIGISTNDSISTVTDSNLNTALSSNYDNLNKMTFAGALIYCLETLRCAFPDAIIIVCTPMQSKLTDGVHNTASNYLKRSQIIRICEYESIPVIDSYAECELSTLMFNKKTYSDDGLHPNSTGKLKLVSYYQAAILSILNKNII